MGESLLTGERNDYVDAYWFGSRYFAGEPLIVPKASSSSNEKEKTTRDTDTTREKNAYLLGVVFDAVKEKSFLAIFDLEKKLQEGPIAKVWFKSSVPHGLHGCFAVDDKGGNSYFC